MTIKPKPTTDIEALTDILVSISTVTKRIAIELTLLELRLLEKEERQNDTRSETAHGYRF